MDDFPSLIAVFAVMALLGITVYSSDSFHVSPDEIQTYRSENCPTSDVNPHKLKRGDLVRIKVSNIKGQILSGGGYRFPDTGRTSNACFQQLFVVRVGAHGIAHDGGNWDSARPEVLPIRHFEHFEIEPWSE